MVFLKKRGTLKATQLNPITAMILSATVRPMAARALNGDGGLAVSSRHCLRFSVRAVGS